MGNYRQVMMSNKLPASRPVSLRHSQRMLAKWAFLATGLQRIRVQARVRGNNLHLLYEAPQYPHEHTIVNQMVPALATTDLSKLLPLGHPPLYQVFLYGRAVGQEYPAWVKEILLNQLDGHLAELEAERARNSPNQPSEGDESPSSDASNTLATTINEQVSPSTTVNTSAAIVLTNRSLAKQGQADGIARFLSETLGMLGVAVRVKVEVRKQRSHHTKDTTLDADADEQAHVTSYPPVDKSRRKRICVYCESSYSPDPSLLAETIAKQLRDLQLEGFRDALIFSQVTGEAQPDWTLRIDLTPPSEILTYIARWGHIPTIQRLLNQSLEPLGIHASCSQKQLSLHVVCQLTKPGAASSSQADSSEPLPSIPPQEIAVEAVRSLLEFIAPQGLYAAFVYGQAATEKKPAWVEWFKLPAADHPALSESAEELAKQGDMPALAFLLGQALNPDIERQLATGGIRVQICRRESFYHVMTDAPVCPDQTGVATIVADCLRQLKIPNISGVRVYGRRAGEKHPVWTYAADFVPRKRLVPQAMPEFAASEQYLHELLVQPQDDAVSPQEHTTSLNQLVGYVRQAAQTLLLRSPLFAPSDLPHQVDRRGVNTALIWGMAGLLLAVFTDLATSNILQQYAQVQTPEKAARPNANQGGAASLLSPAANGSTPTEPLPSVNAPIQPTPKPAADLPTLKSAPNLDDVFNQEGFTSQSLSDITIAPGEKPYTPSTGLYTPDLENSPYPSFNNPQLDKKLALYYERVLESGPPDVLIIGSSRALRGIDPVALSSALAARGIEDVTVFNFGINGSTAQFADLLLQKILLPAQLPKIILWADGSRAFNSGRIDSTYEALTNSESYRLLAQGKPLLSPAALAKLKPTNASTGRSRVGAPTSTSSSPLIIDITRSYEDASRWFDRTLSVVSATYPQRDQLKGFLRDKFATIVPAQPKPETPSILPSAIAPEDQTSLLQSDRDGFLSLSVQFNPATYYQHYARVPGSFDNDYRAFRLQGEQSEALKSLATMARDRNIPLVFINLPLTAEYLDPVRRDYEQQFQRYMLTAARDLGFGFRNLSELWPTENDYFSDPSHLNRYGAYAVAQHLAQDPMIPWDLLHPSLPSSP